MMTRVLLIFCAFTFSFSLLKAQLPTCGTDEKLEAVLQNNPEARAMHELGEVNYREYLQHPSMQRKAGAVVTIPIVFHIVQESGVNTVTDSMIYSQMEVLNEDFRRMAGTPGFGNGVDMEIEFCLATIDPNGCPSSGITRTISPLADHDDAEEAQLKGLIQWDPNKYLNVWVPTRINGGILGYATFPFFMLWQPQMDGVVLHGGHVGRNFTSGANNQGRTLTHEVGHWLGLYHVFQDGCSGATASNCSSAGDRVCDTPQKSAANWGCPTGSNTCTDSPTDLPDPIENYMDYSNDACMNMFSQGQKDRISSQMSTYRSGITSAANLAATGCDGSVSPGCLPVAGFNASTTNGCAGLSVTFTDNSDMNPTSWNWSFPGGNPSASTQQNPTVTYASAGTYDVTLVVTNATGTDSIVRTSYISITNGGNQPPAVGSFEVDFAGENFSVVNADQAITWERSNAAASSGSYSAMCPNYQYNGQNSTDDLISEVYDFSEMTTVDMTFDYAYKKRSGFSSDSLVVLISDDCGLTWTRLWGKGGPYLATVSGFETNNPYVPAASDWKSDSLSLDAWAGMSNIRLMFRSYGNWGQNIYLDNINIDGIVGIEDDMAYQPMITFAPNPSTGNLAMYHQMKNGGEVSIQLMDINGRMLSNESMYLPAVGKTDISSIVSNLARGIYMIRVTSPDGVVIRKIVRE